MLWAMACCLGYIKDCSNKVCQKFLCLKKNNNKRDRQTDKQTEIHADRQINRQLDWQTVFKDKIIKKNNFIALKCQNAEKLYVMY